MDLAMIFVIIFDDKGVLSTTGLRIADKELSGTGSKFDDEELGGTDSRIVTKELG